MPVSGSAYTFSYFSLGEIFAWIIGWDLLLELMLGASVVAQGWSTYAALFLEEIGLGWPDSIGPDSNVNVLAMLLIIVLTILATIGIKESLRVNLALVAVKLFVVLFVIVAGLFYVQGDNLTPFIPPSVPAESGDVTITTPLFQAMLGFTPSTFGVMGLVSGASLVFFAFIGFDVVATTAEEAKNPQRDLPRGILGSLAICTVLYVLVCIVITGMVNYKDISSEAALAEAFRSVGRPGFATLISAGAVAGLTTVVLTLMIGAARVVFAMSRDHLMPSKLGKTHQKFGTPYRLTLGIGIVVALVAGLTPIGKLEEMVNIGTLAAFTLVSIAVPLLRKRPAGHRAVVHGAGQPGDPDPVRGDLRLPDAEPVDRDLAAVRGLDGARLHRLRALRLPEEPCGRDGTHRREHQGLAASRLPPGDRRRVLREGDRLGDGPGSAASSGSNPRARPSIVRRHNADQRGSRASAAQTSAAFFEHTRPVSSV